MSYGQLIWDVPKIESIEKRAFPERRGEAVEKFLALVYDRSEYSKSRARVMIDGKEYYVYGYTVKKGSSGLPWFHYTDEIETLADADKKARKRVFFIIAVEKDKNEKDEKWDGYRCTRKESDTLYYYLFRLEEKPKHTDSKKVEWKDLKHSVTHITSQHGPDHLWDMK